MIRFMADADLNDAIVGGCRRREPAIDFLSANDANLEGVPDPDVLALAAAEDRILVPQHMPIGEVIEVILLIWGASDAQEWRDRWHALPLLYRVR